MNCSQSDLDDAGTLEQDPPYQYTIPRGHVPGQVVSVYPAQSPDERKLVFHSKRFAFYGEHSMYFAIPALDAAEGNRCDRCPARSVFDDKTYRAV